SSAMTSKMAIGPTGAAAFDQERDRRARRAAWRLKLDRTIAVLVPLIAWQLASPFVGKKWISSPIDVAQRIWTMLLDASLAIHTWETFKEAFIGLLVGVVLGVVLGIVLGLYRRLSDAVDPVVMGFYSLPRVSLAPLFIIWLGIGLFAKVALVASMVVFVV